ncbi:hypothetical protein V8D89_000355 [Ganoderma adspersum]
MPREREPLVSRFPKLLKAVVPPLVFLTSTVVNGQDALTPVNFPSKVALCEPVNFTWTGGTAPYWLYIVGYESSGKAVAQNTTGIPTTWFVWIPDIPAVPESRLRIQIGGSDSVMRGGVSLSQLVGEDSSCLDAAPTGSFSTVTSTAPSQPTLVPLLQRSDSLLKRLSKAAVAGIAVAAGVVGIRLVLVLILAVRCALARRRSRVQQPGLKASPYPHPYPLATATSETAGLGRELEVPKVVRVGMPTPPARAVLDPTQRAPPPPLSVREIHSDGYSAVADVGGAGGGLGSPASLSPATDPPLSPTRNFREHENLLVRRHHWQDHKRDCLPPVEPRRNEAQLPEFQQELDGSMPLQAMGELEGASISLEREEIEVDVRRSIGGAEAGGWDVESRSEGTTLPPYAP